MPLSNNELRNASLRYAAVQKRTITEARSLGFQTAFLCHSHKIKSW